MQDNLVSFADRMLGRLVTGFISLWWTHPAIGAAFLLSLAILTAMLWIEVIREGDQGA